MSEFRQKVLEIVCAIPAGSVMSYGDVARLAGHPRAARAVGSIMSHNFDPTVPCHRVVRADGKLGHYNRGDDQKIAKLRAEGYKIDLP